MDARVELEPSRRRGQFDVLVEGRTVASRKGGLLAKLLQRPWPDPGDVVAAVKAAVGGPASG